MTVVSSRCVHPDGTPAAGVYVYAWLRATSTAMADGARVEERVDTYTGSDGRWRLVLPPALAMRDTSAQWSIREVGFDAYQVYVPADPGAAVEASAITTVPGEPPTGGESSVAPMRLSELVDVVAPPPPPGAPPAVLVRGPDGTYRAEQVEVVVAAAQRGDVIHYLNAEPASPPPGVRIGEYVTVLDGPTAGAVYQVQED